MQSILSLFALEGILEPSTMIDDDNDYFHDQDYFLYDNGLPEDEKISDFYYTKKPIIPLSIGKGFLHKRSFIKETNKEF